MKNGIALSSEKICYVTYLLLLALGVTQLAYLSIVNIALSLIIAVIMCFSPISVNIILLFLLVPFFNLYSLQVGTTSLYYLFALIYLFKLLSFKKWRIKKEKVLIVIVAIIITIPWMDIAVQTKWLLLFSLLVLNYKEDIFLNNLPLIVKHISVSTILSSVVGYIMLAEGKSIYTQSYIYSALGNTTRFAGLIGDSVFCGQFIVIIISIVLGMVLADKITRLFGYIVTGILSYFAVITFSRTAIILLAFVIICYYIAFIAKNIHNKKTVHRATFMLGILCCSIFGGYAYITTHLNNPVISKYVIRFSSIDFWTGRSTVIENYLKKFSSSISHYFIGMTYEEYISNGVRVGETIITRAHNLFLETMCLFGLTIMIIVLLFCLLKLGKYIKKRRRIYMATPFLTLLISGVSLHGHLEWPFYFLVALTFGIMDFADKLAEENQNEHKKLNHRHSSSY